MEPAGDTRLPTVLRPCIRWASMP